MNNKFVDLVTKYNADLLNLQADQNKYIPQLSRFHPFLIAVFPNEVEAMFSETKLQKEIAQWSLAKDMVRQVDAFSMDYTDQIITIQLGEEKIVQKFIDVRAFLINDLKVTENTWQYNLILSFFCDPLNFELFQITKVIQA